jgi:hypothetical protein
MAQVVMLKSPQTGIVKKGFYGFSWTVAFWGGFPPLFRGDILTGVLLVILQSATLGLGTFIYAFFYNKQYTTRLLEKGYIFADSEGKNSLARAKLGVERMPYPPGREA